MNQNLSGEQFFHGSRAGWLKAGDMIEPGVLPASETTRHPDKVYVTTSEEMARRYGTVYEVHPLGGVEPDPEYKGVEHKYPAFMAHRAEVVRRLER